MTPSLGLSEEDCVLRRKLRHFVKGVTWEHLAAGTLGGVAATTVLHPLDLVKVRLQVNESQVKGERAVFGIRGVVKSLYREDGVRGLYRGVTPNVVGAGLSWGFYFFFYNHLKQQRLNSTRTNLDPLTHMWIASQAGVATLLLTNPIWVTKTRLCLQNSTHNSSPKLSPTPSHLKTTITHPLPPNSSQNPHYRGMLDCMVKLFKSEGVAGLYKGLVPGLFGVSHGAVQFMVYEHLKTMFNRHHHQPPNHKLTTLEYLTSAAISKVVASTVTYPYQVVRSRLQNQHTHYHRAIDVVKLTYRHEGFGGFFKGLVAGVLRVVPACCITFVVYEHSLHAMMGG